MQGRDKTVEGERRRETAQSGGLLGAGREVGKGARASVTFRGYPTRADELDSIRVGAG